MERKKTLKEMMLSPRSYTLHHTFLRPRIHDISGK